MKERLIRWLLPIIAIVAIATVATLSAPLITAHAASTTGHQTHISTGYITPYSVWHD